MLAKQAGDGQAQAGECGREREEEEKKSHQRSIVVLRPALAMPQPPREQKQRPQRQHEEERTAPVVNDAVDHVRPDVHAEQPDDEDPEPVPHDAERNDEGHQHDPAPRALEKEMRRQQARDEEHPTGVDPAALPRHLEHDAGQREDRAVAQERSARHVEEPG